VQVVGEGEVYIMIIRIRIVYNNNIALASGMNSVQNLTSVFNIPDIEDEIDFKKLY
jgi:hypothetical protein